MQYVQFLPVILFVPSLQLIIPLLMLLCFSLFCGTKLMLD